MPTSNDWDFVPFLEKGCQFWRQGDDQKGIDCFQKACLLWIDRLEQLEKDGEQPSEESLNPLVESLNKLLYTLDEQDIIRATDIIEHEIVPLAKSV